ncbi:MAG: fibrillarin-like rRNA/tRNA 2'-O-methyltransferase [archaeon]
MKPSRFAGIYQDGNRFYTASLAAGRVYDEYLVKEGGVEYREWDIRKSKLAAGLVKGLSQVGMWPGNVVLYLGCATGTTVSHISDLVGADGFVFALDFAPRVMREMVFLCEARRNIAPVLADANRPSTYADKVCLADAVYQDIAQRNQAEIFLKNCDLFLKKDGFGLLCVKARSVDVSKKPKAVFREVRDMIEQHMTIVDYRELAPFEKDHCIFVCKKSKAIRL